MPARDYSDFADFDHQCEVKVWNDDDDTGWCVAVARIRINWREGAVHDLTDTRAWTLEDLNEPAAGWYTEHRTITSCIDRLTDLHKAGFRVPASLVLTLQRESWARP